MATPDVTEVSDCVRDCVQAYANANRGSDAHPLGRATVGTLDEFIPALKNVPSVKGGFAVRFEDGTTYFVNVHRMPDPPASR